MRLSELSPQWYQLVPLGTGMATGLTFRCPNDERRKRVHHIEFTPILNPYGETAGFVELLARLAAEPQRGDHVWRRTGDTFESLTLTPSLDSGCCHISIVNGKVL